MNYIYKIHIKDRVYIGSTHDIKRRIYDHNYCCRPTSSHYHHASYPIYQYCRENSITNLQLEVLEECDDAQRYEREQHYIDIYKETHIVLNSNNPVFDRAAYRRQYMREYLKKNREKINAQARIRDAKRRAEAKLTPS